MERVTDRTGGEKMSTSTPQEISPREQKLARSLGWFSLALGAPQLARPDLVNRAVGVRDNDETRLWQRIVGVRELAASAGILSSRRRPAPWLWARVAGDVKDLALLGAAFTGKPKSTGRLAAATGSVAAVTALDLYTAVRAGRKRGDSAEQDQPVQLKAAITVREPLAEVFAAWENFENFPLFMNHLDSVQDAGNRRSRWQAKGPMGKTFEWEAEVITFTPNEVIEWRSVGGSQMTNSGIVRFRPAPANQGTEIHLHMEYDPPAGKLGEMVTTLLGEDPTSKVKDDLRRFKQLMETGEIVRSEATPEGTASRRYIRQRPAQPLGEDQPVAQEGRTR
jgi:uncharacterized membrane protein